MKKLISLFLAAVMLFALAACGGARPAPAASAAPEVSASADNSEAAASNEGFAEEPSVILKMAEHNGEGTFHAAILEELANQVYQESKGRIKIELFHGGVLGAVTEGLTMLDTGVCDIVWTSTAFFANQFPYTEFTDLPSLGISDTVMATEVWWDVYEKYPELFASEYEGYHVWCEYSGPALVIGTSKHLESPADIKGLNLRAAAGTAAEITAAWGASPTTVSPSDLYLALQKGVVDGYMFNCAAAESLGLDDLTDTVVNVSLGYCPIMYLMSQSAWDSLSPEDQEIMNRVGGRAGSIYSAQIAEDVSNATAESIPNYIQASDDSSEWYSALQAPLTGLTDEYVAKNSTPDFNAQQLIDFALERIAEYKEG